MGLKEKLDFNKNLKEAKKGKPMYQCNVGNCYRVGRGVEQNYNEAVKWYLEAARSKYAPAWYYLSICYENGYGVNKDVEFALQCLFDAEAMGYLQAANDVLRLCGILDLDNDETFFYEHAEKLYNNETYSGHIDCAIVYFTKAAQMGHILSQDKLGYIYINDEYNRNYDKSYEWSLKAAKQGNASSQYRVGIFTEKGIYGTVKENAAEALRWYENAAAQGNMEAKKAVARLKPTAPAPKPTVATKSNMETSKPTTTASSKPIVNPTTGTAAVNQPVLQKAVTQTNKIKEEPKGELQMFYDDEDIKRVATVSAQVRDMAVQKDYDALFEAKKLSLYTFCPINYEIGHRLYEAVEKLEKTWTEDRYEKLVAEIQETGGRIFRYMIENFARDKAQAERNLSAGLRSFFSRQTAKRVTLNYNQIERLINGKLPEIAYGQYKAERFWKECGADFSKSWRDYGYKVIFVYAGNGNDTEVVFEK